MGAHVSSIFLTAERRQKILQTFSTSKKWTALAISFNFLHLLNSLKTHQPKSLSGFFFLL